MKWSAPKDAENVTSLLVGLEPSVGTGLVEAIEDTDHNGVFHITSSDQKLKIIQTSAKGKRTQIFDLSELTLTPASETEGT